MKKFIGFTLLTRVSTKYFFYIQGILFKVILDITIECFRRLISNISHEKTCSLLRKGNLKRETESLLLAAQNNTIRTNHIKARIDKTQRMQQISTEGV